MSQGNGRDARATNRGFHVVAHNTPARPTSSALGALNSTVRAIVAENTHGSGGDDGRDSQSRRIVGGGGGGGRHGNGTGGRSWESMNTYNSGGPQRGAGGGRNSQRVTSHAGGTRSAHQSIGIAGGFAGTNVGSLGGGGVAFGGNRPSHGAHFHAGAAGMSGGGHGGRGLSGGAEGDSSQIERSDGSKRRKNRRRGKGNATGNDTDRSSDASSTGRADVGRKVNSDKPAAEKFEW